VTRVRDNRSLGRDGCDHKGGGGEGRSGLTLIRTLYLCWVIAALERQVL